MYHFSAKIKKYFPFTKTEIRNLVITILFIGFILGFDDGSDVFNAAYYSLNMLRSILIAAVSVLVYVGGQRLFAIQSGYQHKFLIWWPGLWAGLILVIISRGYLWIPFVGGMMLIHNKGQRLGAFRYGLNMGDQAWIAAAGPVASICFATALKQLSLWMPFLPGAEGIHMIFTFNIILALVNLLPIPPLTGAMVIFQNRLVYAWMVGFCVFYAIIALLGYYSWILALLGACITWILYFTKVEEKL